MTAKLSVCDCCARSDFKIIQRSRQDDFAEQSQVTYSSSSSLRLISQLTKCNFCGLVQVNPRLDQNSLKIQYSEVVDEVHSSESMNRVLSFERALSKMGPWASNLKILDIGSAGGQFPMAAQRLGFDAVGVEPSVHLSGEARNLYGLDVRTGLFDPDDFAEDVFDVVSMWDVLEHMESPRKALEQISKVLKPNGYLILNLPMIDTPTARLAGRLWPFYLEVHLFYFSKKTIKKYLEECGYELIKVRAYSQTLSFRYLLNRVTNNRFTFSSTLLDFPLRYHMGQRTVLARRRGSLEEAL